MTFNDNQLSISSINSDYISATRMSISAFKLILNTSSKCLVNLYPKATA